MSALTHNRFLHRIALLTAIVTFPLIFMGGLVTSHGAGLAVPDWPNSYGYNMFTFPPSKWVGGIFYEHTHRLLGTLVGLGATLVMMIAWGWGRNRTARRWMRVIGFVFAAATAFSVKWPLGRQHHLMELFGFITFVLIGSVFCRDPDPRRWVRWLAVGVLAGVIIQGVLGGLRVNLVKLNLAVIHGCVAQAVFCVIALMVLVTSRSWIETQPVREHPFGRKLIVLSVVTVIAVYLQLIVGALMRHHGAGLAIPDLPLVYGRLLPPIDAQSLEAVNTHRVWNLRMDAVSLGKVWLHFGHRVGALIVTGLVFGLVLHTRRRHRDQRGLTRPAALLLLLIIIQFTLGVLTVVMRKPADIASLHVATGALVLITAFVMAARAMRLYFASRRRTESNVVVPPEPKPIGMAAVT